MKIDTTNLSATIKNFDLKTLKMLRLNTYKDIMTTFKKRDLSTDTEFQRMFNGFYRIRNGSEWRKCYYDFFERNKHRTDITFEEILIYMFNNTEQISKSFSSKMLATINSDMPIWDIHVLNQLGLKLSGKSKSEQLENSIKLYHEIVFWYDSYLSSDNAKDVLNIVDELMPEYRWLSPVKKIDNVLWMLGANNIK